MNTTLDCFIIDGDPRTRECLANFAARIPFLNVVGIYDNTVTALFEAQKLKPDLILLDVEMPDMNGFEFIRALHAYRPRIIIVTASPQYAMDGFEHHVTDYILKPISFDRFMLAINKVTELFPAPIAPASKSYLSTSHRISNMLDKASDRNGSGNNPEFLFVKVDKKLVRLITSEIILIQAMKDYIKIHLENKMIVTHINMQKISDILPDQRFLRVNRSYIVQKNAIKEIDGNQITTTNDVKVDIGVTYRDAVLGALKPKQSTVKLRLG